ncbi:MAG TPA: long-chain fatty acid--CoA ligase [Verrucomicrobiota bacterium]|nr:long-chain fatty acid--CoA ligase [Verrucomicrobiota bacterium]HNU52285.1 long-chain fatty acid--CoA ligase [Verrucomicrobiota bacterium]
MNLARAFLASANNNLEKTAVLWGDHTFAYRHFRNQTAWVSGALTRDLGVRRGDRVALWLRNCPEFISAFFGVLAAGGVVVPINNFLKPDEVQFILRDAGITVMITDASLAEGAHRLQSALPELRTLAIDAFLPGTDGGDWGEGSSLEENDLAVLIYTSGTTGHPKGAMLTHGNLLHNVDSCRYVFEAAEFDRFALVLPMFHSFMMTVCMLLPLLVGGSIVLVKSLHPPKNILHEIIQHQATVLPAIPQLFRALAHAPLPPNLSLRLGVSGAAPLPLEILREFGARFPAIPLIEGYGLSEASPVVSVNPVHGLQKPGSIGLPIRNVEMSIRGEDGQELPQGRTGEVCVRGGNVMAGYWNRPEDTAVALRDGWLYTGDVGYRDADGYYYITDRKKDMLLVNGINVYPREIEEVIYQYPGVKEAAVIGRPDPRKGEQPVAFVVMNDGIGLDQDALVSFLRERLADYKVPRRINQLPVLPRNATGKILKTALRTLPH